ncbi:hypothetical protein C7U84_38410, partial [Bradyrhizobium sp. WBAH41]|nr:hypothetical protein [Bradyrhizobium sp. WBAH30]MDD1547645.1 hypothetical protein [Bradyrhizobium sp. WBAH41]MDD1566136.1 hypothetical protein [Bradyrhizobium sp. WBAH33]NRB89809.1 hypothetical protein [Bradyrhizobium sp. WBAH10]
MAGLVRAKGGGFIARKSIPADVRDEYARLYKVRWESWLRKSGQGDKWSFCLMAGKIDPRIRRDDEQTNPSAPRTGI